jgi:hypothetical protein
MTDEKLVLLNASGDVLRVFNWAHAPNTSKADSGLTVIQRKDTKRLEVVSNTGYLKSKSIAFDSLAEVNFADLRRPSGVAIQNLGYLRLVDSVGQTPVNEKPAKENGRLWYAILLLLILFQVAFLGYLMNRPIQTAKIDEEMKQQVVKIVKRIPPKPQPEVIKTESQKEPEIAKTQPKPVKTAAIKRMGALAVLGSLAKSNQRGGLNLGAVNTTAGPGLGGTAGSGGTQTSLYGKGLVAAPLGAGANLQGGGGYGTKGKGGGQAGYGKLSLVGSAGTDPIPLGREALIEGGLDRDLIAEVVARNMGQIRFCYEQGLQGEPALNGRVAVNWSIDGNGQVKTAGIENTTVNSKLVEDCILSRVRSWKFPLPKGGATVKVTYPFVLRRVGQG